MFKIILYRDANGNSPIKSLLDGLNEKAKTDKSARIRLKVIYRYFDLLSAKGSRVGMPFVRHIEGDLWELRPDSDRLFYAFWKDNKFIVLHQYVKESNKTPPGEIDQAKRNLADYLERMARQDENNK
jgi:phage-related protein